MAKAKKRSAAAAAAAADSEVGRTPTGGCGQIAAHIKFFDTLVELIPAKYYHEAGHETNSKFLPKAERAAVKAAAKDAAKAAKKAKLDPDQAKTALDVQREQAEAGPGAQAPDGGRKEVNLQFNIGAGKDTSRDTLKARLASRLEELRKQRKAEERVTGAVKAKEWLQTKAATRGGNARGKTAANGNSERSTGKATMKGGSAGQKDDTDLMFGKVQLAGNARDQHARKPRKRSKAELLAQATAKKEKAAALGNSAEGKELAASEAWQSALARAQGERVLDDPKLLRRSLKKETKQKAKSRDAWQERTRKETEKKDAKQNKRKDNLKRRSDAKIQKKKDKRDKKLLRPGFEGRKLGSIQKKA